MISFLHALQNRNSRVIFLVLMLLSLNKDIIKFLVLTNFHIFGIALLLAANNHNLERKKNKFEDKTVNIF